MDKKGKSKHKLGGISSDELFPNDETSSLKKGESLLDMKAENFTVLNFLGHETDRLKKIHNIFKHKMPNKILYSPTERLIAETNQEILRLQEVLFNYLALNQNSGFHQGLAIQFNEAFKKTPIKE